MSRFMAVRLFGAVLVTGFAAGCGGGGSSGPSQPLISAEAPSGTTGVAYPAFAFTVMSGGIAPFTWSETGALPPGLSLSSSGQLSGTPTRAGTFSISVIVTDSSNPPLMNSAPVNLEIADSPILISAAPEPPDGTAACPYAGFTFMASGGSPGYTWAVTAGSLPAGMALNPNGSLAGTPAAAGPFSFTVTATDSAQTPQAKSHPFEVIVTPSLGPPPLNTPVNTLGGGGAFWMPYTATPVSAGCGPTGVFVIPSNALTTIPTYVTTSATTMVLASGQNVTVNGSNVVTAYSPATLMFAATDLSNNIHVYGLDLVSPSTPTATEISSLSLPLAAGAALNTVICDSHGSAGNLRQPTTVFVVLHIAGTMGCNTTGDVWEVVHYMDSSATAPTVVSITTTGIQELYAPSGALAGLVLLDPASSNLYVYADDNFTAPATAIPGGGIEYIGSVYNDNNNVAASGTAFTGTVLFLAVTKTGSTTSLYRLPYTSTAATIEYTEVGTTPLLLSGFSDGTNLYFTENGNPQLIFQEPLAGGAPTELYSYAVPSGHGPYSLVGSNGSLLVMLANEKENGFRLVPTGLATLPVGTLSAKTTPLSSGNNGVFMVETAPGTPSTALVFVNTLHGSGCMLPGYCPPGGGVISWSSEVLTPGGTVRPGGSYGAFIHDGTSPLSGYVLQVGTPDGGGPWALSALNLKTLSSTTLQTPAGAAFTVGDGDSPQLTGLSNSIGAGTVEGQGLAYDLSKNLVVPIVIADTDVAPF
jgi:large repetitive protein